tara:strand:- start:1225 stop:2073 length:849 start_codon:yes stop_codon:yes gene_type:complete
MYAPVNCVTEKDYYRLWHERGIGNLAPIDVAIVGSLLADRLPWVFTAGYQATLRNAFKSLPLGGWAAFAATENTHNPKAYPGTTLRDHEKGYLLNGHKSWVAHSDIVDYLVVTVNDPGGNKRRAQGLIIERRRAGLTLTQRVQPRFLARMSQGFAKFEDTPINRSEIFEFESIRQFGRTEAKFVMLAGAVFLLARTSASNELQDRLFAVITSLITLLSESETSTQVYGRIDREFQRCVDVFEKDTDLHHLPEYDTDRRLFRMYTDRIQQRVGYAKQDAQNNY